MTKITFLRITKLDAAKGQLRTAIELWFNDGDPVAIHTLLYAAHEILHGLYRRAGHKELLLDLDPEVTLPRDTDATPEELQRLRDEFPRYLKSAANFFKHDARGKASDDAIVFSPNVNEEFITTCLIALQAIGEPTDIAGRTFKFWLQLYRWDQTFKESPHEPPAADVALQWKTICDRDRGEFFRRYSDLLRRDDAR